MSVKANGGYLLIDFNDVDISTSKTIEDIYEKINNTTKRVVACNLVLGDTKFKELTLDVKPIEDGYELSNSIIKVTIGATNNVVGEEQTSETIVYSNKEDFLDALEDLFGHSYCPCAISETNSIYANIMGGINYQGDIYVGESVALENITSLDSFTDGIYYLAINMKMKVAVVIGGVEK